MARLSASDLYDYLVTLSRLLEGVGELEAARRVTHVSRFVSGSPSELFGEARLLLPRLLSENSTKLSTQDRAELQAIVVGIENEFRRIGGG